MKRWAIEYQKYSEMIGEVTTHATSIDGISSSDALVLRIKGLEQARVVGEVIQEIDQETGAVTDYTLVQNN